MKKYLRYLLTILPLLFLFFNPNTLYAVPASYICPGSYQTIMTGDSMTTVQQACGKPASVNTQTKTESVPLILKQWVYIKTQKDSAKNVNKDHQTDSKLVITFNKDKVIQINLNNELTSSQFPCYQMKKITVGSQASHVRFQCGYPTTINSVERATTQPLTISQWTYDFGTYKPTIIFTFKNSVVTDIRMGPMGK